MPQKKSIIDVNDLLQKLQDNQIPEITDKDKPIIQSFMEQFNIVSGPDRINKFILRELFILWGGEKTNFFKQISSYLVSESTNYCISREQLKISSQTLEYVTKRAKGEETHTLFITQKTRDEFNKFLSYFELKPIKKRITVIPIDIMNTLYIGLHNKKITKNLMKYMFKQAGFIVKRTTKDHCVWVSTSFYNKVPKEKINELLNSEKAHPTIKREIPSP